MKHLILAAVGEIVVRLFFYKDDLNITYPMMVDMPLNKETKPSVKKNNLQLTIV